ncbi:MAG: MMPL family transporter, partial [Vallitaleaceae bacterium]|nr:MMPL family transporter [Vallitaleaceae bacterium]
GIIFSFLAVMIFLPVVTLIFYKWIDKTLHKDFLPHPGKISSILVKTRIPFFILSILIVLPMFLAQSNVSFIYGMPSQKESRDVRDKAVIDEVFGTAQLLLLMVPKEDVAREKALADELSKIPHIKQVVSYAENVGTKIPSTYVPETALAQFYSENYARIILYTDLASEGETTFNTVEQILSTTKNYYSDYYLTGEGATMNDMKNVVNSDMGLINLIAIVGIFIILLLTFRSLTLPLILIFTIESAIWINLAIPYFTDTPISFIGYLIISTVQLGATVDYAILMTHKYMEERRKTGKREAMWDALKNNIAAVMVSATILASAGFVLAATTNNAMIKELGNLLGRGTVLSFIMVAAVLPALLIIFDKAIQWTTLGHGFFNEKEHR